MDYTESQKIAADPTRDVIVTAGAGTGKTTVLSLRTLRYLEDFDPSQISDAVKKIVAITFTNKAANEMRERIFEQVFARFREATTGKEAQKWFKIYRDIENAHISTIHSLCRTLLTRFPLEAEVMPNFSVDNAAIDPAEYIEEFLDKMATEKSELMRKVRDYADRWEIRNILTAIYEGRQYLSESLYQLCEELPDKLAKKYADFIENYGGNVTDTNADSFMDSLLQVADITIKIAQLYTEFEKFIRSGYRAVSTLDFNQLVIGGLKLVKQFSEEQMKYIAPEQLMVDEFQDTSPIQWELIEHLAGYSGRVMFVGDEKQSIYRFRGADVTVVRSGEEFIGKRAHKTIVSMDKNFRTHPRLLSVINRIFKGIFPEISQNDYEARYQELIPGEEKKWENPQKAGFYIVLPDSFESQEEAVSGIIKQILAEKEKWDEEDLGKFMVLANSNDLVSSVVSHLRREGIPALALTPHGFWASEEISFFVHLLNFLHEPRNTKDLFYLLTSPIFGVDSETIRRLPSSTPEDFLWNRIEKNYQDGTI
ncbi:UvrD-helicase domain-containing protein, partial [bacterium]|nr:UvrD-helicase domain-containing protein [bacterium]